MASDTKNVKLGVCKVLFNNVDLGLTQGGVEVDVTTDTHVVEVDQFGKTPINEYIMGRKVSVSVPLAETTLKNLVAIMPGATLTDGAPTNDDAGDSVIVTTGVGTDLLSIAKELRLHPVGKADSDVSDDFVIFKAATAGALKFAYKVDAERIFNTTFTGYPDATTGKLFGIGNAKVA